MAFVFKVEDGTGYEDSNSYASVAYADDYAVVQPTAHAVWDALTDEQKQSYLALATRYLDQKVDWKGEIATDEQALRWPRKYAYTRDRVAIGQTVVPKPVKDATVEMALYLMTNDPAGGQDVSNLKKIVVDVVEIEYQEGTGQPRIPSLINSILYGLGFFVSGGRGFGRIVRA